MTNNTVSVYELEWNNIIYNNYNDGLWINNNNIALHLPAFRNKNTEYANISFYKIVDKLYYNYDGGVNIKKLNLKYYDLNDIVFTSSPWENNNLAHVYLIQD